MKRILTTAILLIAFLSIQAQISDSTKIEQYCQVVCTARMLSNKVTVDVDYGEFRALIGSDKSIKDEEGKLVKFNGVVDALNFMGRQGWTLQNAYAMGNGGGGSVYHFYFKKVLNKSDMIQKADK